MHIDPTTHEHGATAKVYVYEGDYEVGDSAITWRAQVVCGQEVARRVSGSIPLTSPGVATVAEQAVRDAILQRIDGIGNQGRR